MKYCVEKNLSVFEFHDAVFSLVRFDGKDLVISAARMPRLLLEIFIPLIMSREEHGQRMRMEIPIRLALASFCPGRMVAIKY